MPTSSKKDTAEVKLTKTLADRIDNAVNHYKSHRTEFRNLANRVERDLMENNSLFQQIHSTKYREKDPSHLKDKLQRKAKIAKTENKDFTIDKCNLFDRVGDLAGVRLLHIYRAQLEEIVPLVSSTLEFHGYKFREDPKAFTWDVESKNFFEGLGFEVETRHDFYTSLHYVVEPHWGGMSCEIQVRTLAEELWGEVSHTINYPHRTESVACIEQLAALARTASSCTRLVDSIYASKKEFDMLFEQ